jgi:catechol 2,3-dioxygenase-like lactoylglutathione lyase family enzyme
VKVHSLDHVALAVADVPRTCRFYADVLGMTAREERPGKWCLDFGRSKISVHDVRNLPEDAKDALPGTGNFCVLTDSPIEDIVAHLARHDVRILNGPVERIGGVGPMTSVYFKDPDGHLVEVSKPR